jgi:hypothetical protein
MPKESHKIILVSKNKTSHENSRYDAMKVSREAHTF